MSRTFTSDADILVVETPAMEQIHVITPDQGTDLTSGPLAVQCCSEIGQKGHIPL